LINAALVARPKYIVSLPGEPAPLEVMMNAWVFRNTWSALTSEPNVGKTNYAVYASFRHSVMPRQIWKTILFKIRKNVSQVLIVIANIVPQILHKNHRFHIFVLVNNAVS
jgi:hypothetical protein